jgi:hypothetical protein
MIETVFLIGFLAAAAKILTLWKLGVFKKLLAFDWALDFGAGAMFAWLFFGTLTGMAIATMAGLLFSAGVYAWKKAFGYERIERRGWRLKWIKVQPAWTR